MRSPKITAEQSQAVQRSHGRPVYLVDESGADASLAIVRVELLRTLLGDDFDITDTYQAQETALAAVWDDPQLDEYTDNDGTPVE